MKIRTLAFICGFVALIISSASCTSGGKNTRHVPVYYEINYSAEEDGYAKSGDEISVPFREEGGVKYVQVQVNGMHVEMIFDTGCSITLISMTEAAYLYNKGLLTQEDVLGTGRSQIADGSIVEETVINLKEVIIDDKIYFSDVMATVSNSVDAPLLLGNEILDRAATVTIDNENRTLNFKMK